MASHVHGYLWMSPWMSPHVVRTSLKPRRSIHCRQKSLNSIIVSRFYPPLEADLAITLVRKPALHASILVEGYDSVRDHERRDSMVTPPRCQVLPHTYVIDLP